MSKLKHMSQDLVKNLLEIKSPHIQTTKHKEKLKKKLLQSAYNQKSPLQKLLHCSPLFAYSLKTMSLKKIIPTAIVAILLVTLVGQNYLAWQSTAYAQELINKTIEKVQNAPPQTEEVKKLFSTLQILEEAKKSGELEYLGEKKFPVMTKHGMKIQEFRFTDEDLSSDIIIWVGEKGSIEFRIDSELSRSMIERIDLKVDKEGKIINLEELKGKLKDPNLTQPWLKELLKTANKELFNKSEKPIDTTVGLNSEDDSYEKKYRIIAKKVDEQLQALAEESEVLLQPGGGGYDHNENYHFSIGLYALTGQKARNSETRANIQKAIDKLSQFNTDSAQKKTAILQKALQSNRLRSYDSQAYDASLSFPYIGAGDNEELYLYMDFKDTTENFIHITFTSEAFTVMPGSGKGEWVDIKVVDNKIENLEELQKKFKDPNLHDDLVHFIIKKRNNGLAKGIKKEIYDSKKGGNPLLTAEVAEQIEQLLLNADVPVIDISISGTLRKPPLTADEKFVPGLVYSFGIYPMGNPPNSNAVKTVDEAIEKLKTSANADKEEKIKFLKEAQQAKDLRYEGKVQLENGDALQKIYYVQAGKRIEITFDNKGNSYRKELD